MNDYITMLNKHKINGGFLAPDYIPFEERNKNEMLLELQNEIHTKDKEIERLNNKLKDIKSKLDYLETYSSKEDVFEDMKRRLYIIDKIIGSDK